MKAVWITDKIQEKTVQIYSNPTPVCGNTDVLALVLKIESQVQLRDKEFLLWYLIRIFMMHYFTKVECAETHTHGRLHI